MLLFYKCVRKKIGRGNELIEKYENIHATVTMYICATYICVRSSIKLANYYGLR